MYAVVKAGGKQERVAEGDQVLIELPGAPAGSDIELGPKIRGFTYRPKTRRRRRWGHRQQYATVEITSITLPAAR